MIIALLVALLLCGWRAETLEEEWRVHERWMDYRAELARVGDGI